MPRENRALTWALLVSLLAHGGVLLAPARFWQDIEQRVPEPAPLLARLVEPEPPPPPPPAPPAPKPPPPAPKPPPAPPKASTQAVKPLPAPSPAPLPEPFVRPEPLPAPSPAPMPAEVPTARLSATPAPPQLVERAPDLPLLVGKYSILLKSEMRRQLEYPPRARDEGWEGEGRLLLVVGESGGIAELRVLRSSGYALLDRTLLEGARRAHARVEIPPDLRGRRFRLEIPFVMSLVDQ